jgi:peptide/nickel transport system substrate-binding protein
MLVILAAAGAACTGAGARTESQPFAVALPYSHDNLDPHGDGTLRTHMAQSFNVYEALVQGDEDLRLRPGLARSWSTVDDRTWVFELREARLHSGRLVTAEDVVYALRRAAGPGRDTNYYLQDLESVRATGPRTVELRTRGPAPRLLNRLIFVMIVPADVGDLSHRADGTGPYKVEAWEPDRRLVLRRHEAWWGGQPSVERAVFHFNVGGRAAEDGLLNGAFQLSQFVAGFRPDRVAASPRHQLVEQEDFYVTYLSWNVERPPFSDPRVRHALSLALSRAELAARLPRRAHAATQLVSRHVFGFDPALSVPDGDMARARALLATAGHPEGLTARLTVRERYREVAGLLAAQLAAAGVRLEVEVEPEARYFERLNRRELALWLDNWGCTTGDAAELFENALHSRKPGAALGRFNETGYANPALDARIEALGVLEGDERRSALQHVMRTVLQDQALVPLYSDLDVYGVGREQSWRPRPDASLRLVELRAP